MAASAHRTITPTSATGSTAGPPLDLTVRETFGQVRVDGSNQGCDNG
jgi:hypothetical protein